MPKKLTKSRRGGLRANAKRPTFYDQAMKRKNLMLDQDTTAFYMAYADDNLSEGVRNLWREIPIEEIERACSDPEVQAWLSRVKQARQGEAHGEQ